MDETKIFPVVGMHCVSCASVIGKVLQKIPGVIEVDASYATEKAKIIFNPDTVKPTDLNNAIKPFGYELILPADESNHHDHAENNDIPVHNVGIAFVLAIVVFVVMIWETISTIIPFIPEIPISQIQLNTFLFIAASISLWGFGGQFVRGAIRFARYGHANMDTLVGLGTMTAYFYSSFELLFPQAFKSLGLSPNSYFDIAIVVIGFILFGKYLEAKAKRTTGDALAKLMGLQVKSAWVIRNKKELEIPVAELVVGDVFLVKPGFKVPVDGLVIRGESAIDASMVTGEAIPVEVSIGHTVIGGTVNLNGALECRATKIGNDTLLSQIMRLVFEAQNSKAPIEKLADKISEIFVPIVLGIAVIAFLVWFLSGFFGNTQNIPLALNAMIGILVIACPCALGLATPTAMIAAVGRGAGMGILVKDAESLEILSKIDTVALDKTGTITQGKPVVTDIYSIKRQVTGDRSETMSFEQKEILRLLASLERLSAHPLAYAVTEKAKAEKIRLEEVSDFKSEKGLGITGKIGGKVYICGNRKYLSQNHIPIEKIYLDQESETTKIPVYLAHEKTIIGLVWISDPVKLDARNTINELKKLGIGLVMLSGDRDKTAQEVGQSVGIDKVFASILPAEKSDVIRKMKAEGKIVAMVGDGVNDAPALAAAQVGVAMSTGTDAAISTANITLLHGDIGKLLTAIKLSQKTMRIVKENLFWAFAYNVIGIPIAAGLLYPFTKTLLNPMYGGMAMALSSVMVVTNSLRLKKIKI